MARDKTRTLAEIRGILDRAWSEYDKTGEIANNGECVIDALQEASEQIEALQKFITDTAEPALSLAALDYPVSHGPRTNLMLLKAIKTKFKFA